MMYRERPTDFAAQYDIVSCFLEHEGKMLLLHRQDHKAQGNTWGSPAGKVDLHEDFSHAMRREIFEETGYVAPEVTYVDTVFVRFPAFDFNYHMFHHAVEAPIAVTINPREHKGYRWVTPQEALRMNLIQDQDACIKLFFGLSCEPHA